jgi:formylglycine-generating enzyme required for sulfatase activity
LLLGIIAGLLGWINQDYIKERYNWFAVMRPYMHAEVLPYVLPLDKEKALLPLSPPFRECKADCPEMIVLPAGPFTMGSPDEGSGKEDGRYPDEKPHRVRITTNFAVSQYPVTINDWNACVSVGGCQKVSASGFGNNPLLPVINVNWQQANMYAAWLSRMTNQNYRLLTEAEWEYAARAGTSTAFWFGNDIAKLRDYAWYEGNAESRTHEVNTKLPNAFGLYHMHGNVWQWVQDCYVENYDLAPTDGSAVNEPCDSRRRVTRGASWENEWRHLRSARRGWYAEDRQSHGLGFRLARSLRQ